MEALDACCGGNRAYRGRGNFPVKARASGTSTKKALEGGQVQDLGTYDSSECPLKCSY